MDIRTVPVADVTPDRANARKHGDKNLAAIKASLRQFGQQKPIVVDKRMVCMAGNGTLAAAIGLGMKTIDVVVSDLSVTELRAFAIADNRTGELAEWDRDVLASLLESIREEDPGVLDATGYDTADVDALLQGVGAELSPEAAYDPVPSLPSHRPAPLPPVPADAKPEGGAGADPVNAALAGLATAGLGEDDDAEDGVDGPAAVAGGTPPATASADSLTPDAYCCPACGHAWSGDPKLGEANAKG